MSIAIAAFYRFVTLTDYVALQAPLLEQCQALGIKGSILLAEEGLNAIFAKRSESQKARSRERQRQWAQAQKQASLKH